MHVDCCWSGMFVCESHTGKKTAILNTGSVNITSGNVGNDDMEKCACAIYTPHRPGLFYEVNMTSVFTAREFRSGFS